MNTATQGTNGVHGHTVSPSQQALNVGKNERVVSLVAGGFLALYGLARRSPAGLLCSAFGAGLLYRGWSGHCPLYSAFSASTAESHGLASVPAGKGVKLERGIVIGRPVEDVYSFWRNLENLPRFVHHLRFVTVHGSRSHWVAVGPLGVLVEWDAEIINEKPNELIAWRSLPGSEVDSAGSVHFQAGPNSTWVWLSMKYNPPAGKVGIAVAHLFGADPESQLAEDLVRLKHLLESGAGLPLGHREGSRRWSW